MLSQSLLAQVWNSQKLKDLLKNPKATNFLKHYCDEPIWADILHVWGKNKEEDLSKMMEKSNFYYIENIGMRKTFLGQL